MPYIVIHSMFTTVCLHFKHRDVFENHLSGPLIKDTFLFVLLPLNGNRTSIDLHFYSRRNPSLKKGLFIAIVVCYNGLTKCERGGNFRIENLCWILSFELVVN